uniref:(California timema) hypothetical protein n=1 Tax=Timema californicum TaxID=61474 RepID=A0A7R9JK36_TIMCA|nr:unnamed protein product [Timema californicum]
MPLSGLLSEYGFAGGWPSIFYVFGTVGAVWSLLFLVTVYESPDEHPHIADDERKYITSSVWGSAGVSSPPIPWKAILRSMPFWAILVAHMGQNYGYETLMTELPTFMNAGPAVRHKTERDSLGSPLPRHVDLLDVGEPRGRLDDLQSQVLAHADEEDCQRYR